ncbi:MAG: peptidylprolyl isomerase [Planctomycetota bacterium]
MERRFVAAALTLAVAACAAAGALPFGPPMPPSGSQQPHPAIEALRGYSATIHTTLGDMEVAFEPDEAPNAVRNFIKLALKGFYDGSPFYAVFRDKMILAGDPTGKGTGDAGHTLDFEGTFLGAEAGALMMDTVPQEAKDRLAGKKNSGSRFFIAVTDQAHLDGDYTTFARITWGLDVAERVSRARAIDRDGAPAPVEDLVIERITIATRDKEAEEAAREAEDETD